MTVSPVRRQHSVAAFARMRVSPPHSGECGYDPLVTNLGNGHLAVRRADVGKAHGRLFSRYELRSQWRSRPSQERMARLFPFGAKAKLLAERSPQVCRTVPALTDQSCNAYSNGGLSVVRTL